MKEKQPVHLALRNKKFINGLIIKVADNYFVMLDKKLGRVHVLFEEVYKIGELQAKQ